MKITPHVSPLSEISINHIFKNFKQRGVVVFNSGLLLNENDDVVNRRGQIEAI